MANWGGPEVGGWKDEQKDGRLEIQPYALQDIGPLGPLPKKGGKAKVLTISTKYHDQT